MQPATYDAFDEFDLLGADEPTDPLTDRLLEGHARLDRQLEELFATGTAGWTELRIHLASHLRAEREVVYERLAGVPELEFELPAFVDGHTAIEVQLARSDARGNRLRAVLARVVKALALDETNTLLPLVREALEASERRALAERFDERRRELVGVALRGLKRDPLLALARVHGVRGRGRMNKAALAEVLVA